MMLVRLLHQLHHSPIVSKCSNQVKAKKNKPSNDYHPSSHCRQNQTHDAEPVAGTC